MTQLTPPDDKVNHPQHYLQHPSGVECINITEHMTFNVGNAMKYLWRADWKGGLDDLKKAQWYVAREIERREKRVQVLQALVDSLAPHQNSNQPLDEDA